MDAHMLVFEAMAMPDKITKNQSIGWYSRQGGSRRSALAACANARRIATGNGERQIVFAAQRAVSEAPGRRAA